MGVGMQILVPQVPNALRLNVASTSGGKIEVRLTAKAVSWWVLLLYQIRRHAELERSRTTINGATGYIKLFFAFTGKRQRKLINFDYWQFS